MYLKCQTFLNSFIGTGLLVFFLCSSYGSFCCVSNAKSKLQRDGYVDPRNLSQMFMAILNKWFLWKAILNYFLMIISCLEIKLDSNKTSKH